MSVWTSCLIALCALVQAPTDVPTQIAKERFPLPQRALTLTWTKADGPSMLELFEAFARATDSRLLYSADARALLLGMDELDLPGKRIAAPPEEVFLTFERLLLANDLLLVPASDTDGPRVHRVLALGTQDRNGAKRHALYEPIETVEPYRRHPAVLVTTYLPVSSGIVNMVSNQMRPLLSDPNTQQIVPAGDGLILTGLGPFVCDLVECLRDVDARFVAGETIDEETLKALLLERFPPPTEATEESK